MWLILADNMLLCWSILSRILKIFELQESSHLIYDSLVDQGY